MGISCGVGGSAVGTGLQPSVPARPSPDTRAAASDAMARMSPLPARTPHGRRWPTLGEFGLIAALRDASRRARTCWSGRATTPRCCARRNGHVVVSTDLLVEGRHFRRDWAGAADIGHKAAAQNLVRHQRDGRPRDGAHRRPRARPPTCRSAWALDLADGIAEEAALVGASVVGGDLTARRRGRDRDHRAGRLQAGAGAALGRPAGRRGRAAGRQGWAAAGLAVLGRGFRSPRVLVEALPAPRAAVRRRSGGRPRPGATAMIDVSDGLLADARPRRRRQSGVAIDVTPATPSRSPSRCRRSAPRWASTRCSSCSAAATTTRWSRRSRATRRCRRAGGGSAP